MTELESVVAHWKTVAEVVALDRHPSVWVGHYADVMLGDCHSTKPRSENAMVILLASPFAVCDEIAETWVIRDRPNHLLVTRLDDGVTHWKVPYVRDDRFRHSFGVVEMWHGDALWGVCQALLTHRTKGRTHDFAEAFWYAVRKGAAWEM